MSKSQKLWSYQCEWDGCNRSFNGISNFEAHYRRHTDQQPYPERPFACMYESCGQAFQDSETLDHHHRTHTEQLPFGCKYDSCGQTFHSHRLLIEHHSTHKVRPLACKYDSCSRKFARKENLEAHMHMHIRERPFPCPYKRCRKSFCDRWSLVYHENTHMGKDSQPHNFKSSDLTGTSKILGQHHPEKQKEETKSVKEIHPIRLRLSQPRRPDSDALDDSPRKRIMLRLPLAKILHGSSTTDPKEAHEPISESKIAADQSTHCTKKTKVHQEACPPHSGLDTSFTSKASSDCQVYSRRSDLESAAVPSILTHTVHSKAPTLEAAVTSRSTEDDCQNSHANTDSIVHCLPIYTKVCGVYSIERAFPEKGENKRGRYHCPRCDTQFTRSRGVRRHFVGCITKHGNPNSLKWMDHESLQGTANYYACNGYRGQQYHSSHRAVEDQKTSSGLATSTLEEKLKSPEPVFKPHEQDALRQKDVVQPICKRRDALRRSQYNPETIARDVLLAIGRHPDMDPLNAHLDILRRKFQFVNLDSNMATFRWDLVDPEQNSEHDSERRSEREDRREPEPERQIGQAPEILTPSVLTPERDATKSKVNDIHRRSNLPLPLPSRSTIKSCLENNEAPFRVILPEMAHFNSMSTLFSSVFDRNPSARLMSSHKDLRAAIFSMLEYCYWKHNFVVRAAFGKNTGDLIGWIACHDVEQLGGVSLDPLESLDWMTAAHLLPSQISRFASPQEQMEAKAERLYQRDVGHALALTTLRRAGEAQTHLVPIPRFVVNALVVHPSHQGGRVASTLLKSVTNMVDLQKRPIWVQAPIDPTLAHETIKTKLFWRAGFTFAGELNVNMDSYAKGSRESAKGKEILFGTYKWNYMLRWPQPVRQKLSRIIGPSSEPRVQPYDGFEIKAGGLVNGA